MKNGNYKKWIEQKLNAAEADNVQFDAFWLTNPFDGYRRHVVVAISGEWMAFAICHPNDQFDRKYGRAIAYSRLPSQSAYSVDFAGGGEVSSAASPKWGIRAGKYEYFGDFLRDVAYNQMLTGLERAGLVNPTTDAIYAAEL